MNDDGCTIFDNSNLDSFHTKKMENCDLSIFDDIISDQIVENTPLALDKPTDTLMVMKKQDIEYEVTLQGFWDNIETRVWKSHHKLFKIDDNNYASIVEKTEDQTNSEPPAFSITMLGKQNATKKKRKTQ